MREHSKDKEPDYYTFGENQSDFIREKIVRRTSAGKELLRLFGQPVAGGCLFGLSAALVFLVVLHFFSGNLQEDDTKEDLAKAETTLEKVPDDSMPQNEEELRYFVSSVLTNGEQEESVFADQIQTVIQSLENSLVTVVARKKDVDWFEVRYDSQYSQSGLLIRKDQEAYYILTGYSNLRSADSILLEMPDGTQTEASLNGYDTVFDAALLSIPREKLSASTDKLLKTVKIGKLSTFTCGMPVLAVGNPSGIEGSIGLGFISYLEKQLALTDGFATGIQSSICVDTSGCSFLMGMNGEVIGIFTNSLQESETGYSLAYGMDSLMLSVNRMLKGKTTAGIGITGQEIAQNLRKENSIPEGVYVTNVKKNSAAYQAGLQSGDVLTSLDGKKITSMEEYEALLKELTPAKEVKMIVYRNSKGAYKKMEFKITPTVRQG